ncbi:hypothetical protein DFA_09728 [Cavenderia fasciculata]|uniref:Ankyrin repeat-containing protein n=1 Tax=Cavenderia fasciculata TaxID=261658 RepID=F4Q8F6_CACFS|nr:uncharacterized protein DFA_09728 [Cavenderia fasciculata]EGG16056.1 hypothetical protein DFA_09728 [Cavenderia fasciculata]|eukprot:XP_004352381.1 hypothetical protein DFA_09728 [Cavenderia fasciculata]
MNLEKWVQVHPDYPPYLGYLSICKKQETPLKVAENSRDENIIKSVITNKQLFKTIIAVGRTIVIKCYNHHYSFPPVGWIIKNLNLFECHNYISLTSAEWIVRNQYYGLLEYKLKRNDHLHFSLASIQMMCNHLGGDMKLFNLIYEKKRSMFFSDTLLECAATSGNTQVFKILLDQTYPKRLNLFNQPSEFSRWIGTLYYLNLEEVDGSGVIETIEWILCQDPLNKEMMDSAHALSRSLTSLNKQEKRYIIFAYYFNQFSKHWEIVKNYHSPLVDMYTKYYSPIVQESMSLEDDMEFIKSLGEETLIFISFLIKLAHLTVKSLHFRDLSFLRCIWASLLEDEFELSKYVSRYMKPSKSLEILMFFQQKSQELGHPLYLEFFRAIRKKDHEMIEYLFQIDGHQKIIQELDNNGELFLTYTSYFNQKVAKILLDNPATPTIPNDQGWRTTLAVLMQLFSTIPI